MSSQKGENKRVVKKAKNGPTVNIKVSTGDPDVLEKANVDSQAVIPDQTTKRTTVAQKNKEEKLNELKSKTTTLIEKLENTKNELLNEKQQVIDEVRALNEEISIKTSESNELSKKNTKLISQLKNVEKEIDDKFNSVDVSKVKQKKEKRQATSSRPRGELHRIKGTIPSSIF